MVHGGHVARSMAVHGVVHGSGIAIALSLTEQRHRVVACRVASGCPTASAGLPVDRLVGKESIELASRLPNGVVI